MAPTEPMMPAELAPEAELSVPRGSRSASSHRSRMTASSIRSSRSSTLRAKLGLEGIARRTLGIACLLLTVFLWTLSNFLASYIFSDDTYDKPFFVVYINTSIFAISLIPMLISYIVRNGFSGFANRSIELWREVRHGAAPLRAHPEHDDDDAVAGERLLVADDDESVEAALDLQEDGGKVPFADEKLNLRETAWLSFEFCMVWFVANYFASACLQYTSVGSVTILTSTSSVWTLVFCALARVEVFSLRKLIGVLASLAGVILISTVDLSGASDEDRGSFPHKSQAEMAIGDAMALFSAIIYGVYVTLMKQRVGNEDRVDMQLFFGLVGLFNVLFLWPGFFILHFTGLETFEMPPTGKIWMIIMINSIASFVSDISWAYAMLFTTPLVVTVGLSLTIPLSLIGEMFQYGQYSSWIYWVGAGVVLTSFLFINHESKEEIGSKEERPADGSHVANASAA